MWDLSRLWADWEFFWERWPASWFPLGRLLLADVLAKIYRHNPGALIMLPTGIVDDIFRDANAKTPRSWPQLWHSIRLQRT
jgi:hypothetical protein